MWGCNVMARWFEPQTHLTQALSAVLCITLAWTPFAIVWADDMQAAGQNGQQLGRSVVQGFQFPRDLGDGTITLNPGTSKPLTLSVSSLFPDSTQHPTSSGGITDLSSLYGNDPATLAAGLDAQTRLSQANTLTGEAYRSVIHNAHQSHPDLQHEAMWQAGDDVMKNFTPWATSFSDCQSTNTFSNTQRSVSIPAYQLCLRQPKVAQYCTATHHYHVEPLIRYVSGSGGLSSCGPGCLDLYVGRVGDNYWEADCNTFTREVTYEVLHPEAITSATLAHVKYDDHTRIMYDGQWLYTGHSGWDGDCELSQSWDEYPNINVHHAFSSRGYKTFRQETRVGGYGEGYSRIRLQYDVSKLISQDQWQWSGPNCQTLANAITDRICQSGSQLRCTDDPAQGGSCFIDPQSQVMVCGWHLARAPVAYGIGNTCRTIEATGPCDLNRYGQCWTDSAGTHCLSPPPGGIPQQSCSQLETQGCSFIRSQCIDVLASGTCWNTVDTYDCGQTVAIPSLQSNTQQRCSGPIRCLGEDCIDVDRTHSQAFSKAIAYLNTAQQMAMDMSCDAANATLQQKDPSSCQVFKGKPASCKMVGGVLSLVNCCETPSGSVGLGQYIDLLMATSQLDNAVMTMNATSAVRGAWETMRTPFTLTGDAWRSFQTDFASTVNDLVGTDLLSSSDVASQGLLDSLKGELLKSVAEWIGNTFGQAAGNALFSAGGQAAFDAAGNLSPAAQSGGVQLGGGAAFAGQVLSTIMTAYTVAMIIVMIVQIVWSCETSEYELAAQKQLKVCKDLGTFCAAKEPLSGLCLIRKESYCCYNSPLARILNEQIKPQLGLTFGTAKNPLCNGIKVNDLNRVNWDKVNLDEWLGILALTGHLPTASNAAALLNLDQLTGRGSRLNPQKYGATTTTRQNTLTRTQGRMNDLDVPTVKRQSELEGWGMGPQ